jgi:hypothetical protein
MGNRTHDLLACRVVCIPTTLLRTPFNVASKKSDITHSSLHLRPRPCTVVKVLICLPRSKTAVFINRSLHYAECGLQELSRPRSGVKMRRWESFELHKIRNKLVRLIFHSGINHVLLSFCSLSCSPTSHGT